MIEFNLYPDQDYMKSFHDKPYAERLKRISELCKVFMKL